MIRISYVVIAMALSVQAAHGQAILKGSASAAKRLSTSPALRELVAEASRESALAKDLMEFLGYTVESPAAAKEQLKSLPLIDLSDRLLSQNEVHQSWSKPGGMSSDPLLACSKWCRETLRNYGQYTVGAGGTVGLSVYAGALVNEYSGSPKRLSPPPRELEGLDVGKGQTTVQPRNTIAPSQLSDR